MSFDSLKKDFPLILNKNMVYLDTAASGQKPQAVIDAVSHFYQHDYANVKRGIYDLSEGASNAFEFVREKTRGFINAESKKEIVFTRGTTEAINLIAESYGVSNLQAGDEIILSYMEHHANIVPWFMLCQKTGAALKIVPLTDEGELDLTAFKLLITERTKIVSITHVSNVLGTVNPISEITRIAHAHNAIMVVDGAQAVAHRPVDVKAIDCDFYVFSSHKVYGPSGVGVLYGKEKLLKKMPPYQTGGDMIKSVSFKKIEFNELPFYFEAGTPNIEGVIGFGAALDYMSRLSWEDISAHEKNLLLPATEALKAIKGLRIYGESPDKNGIISFIFGDVHPHDVATILNQEHIAVRAGHHCAQPLMDFYNVPALTRVSFGLYNDLQDVEALIRGLHSVKKIFGI